MPLALVLGCSNEGSETRDAAPATQADAAAWHDIVVADEWRKTAAEDDPLAQHRPDPVECDIAGWFVEDDELEINTARCNYLFVEQPALVEVGRGDLVRLGLRHFDLTAPEPATAHVALLFGDVVVWELDLTIPHEAQVLDVEWTAQRALPAGAPVGLHLHNHGQNTWTLAHVRTRGE